MKKIFALGAFAFVCLAATSAHAQSTISPVPGAKDTPHETSPSNIPSEDPYGRMKSADQQTGRTSAGNVRPADGYGMKQGKRSGKHKMKNKNMPSSTGTM